MKFLLLGGGERHQALCRALIHRGAEAVYLDDEPALLAASAADVVVFPIPTPPQILGLDINQVIAHCQGFSPRLVGAWSTPPPPGCENLLASTDFKQANAIPTAEGALAKVLCESNRTYHRSQCLITGYGALGQALCHRLTAYGAKVFVWTRRDVTLPGGVLDFAFGSAAPAFDFIFNTVPAQVLSPQLLSVLPAHCRLCELASPPYGFDHEAARAMGLGVQVLPGVPRMFPHSAAELTAEYLLRIPPD